MHRDKETRVWIQEYAREVKISDLPHANQFWEEGCE